MGVSFSHRGSFKNMESFLQRSLKLDIRRAVESYAQEGVRALELATPVRSGLAAKSWGYEIVEKQGLVQVIWTNSDVENGFPVAIMLQYGYGTGTGGYVQGRDYINPAIKPVFDKIATSIWKAVKSA